ncbi:MAG: FIST N-terminal domain-containing protein [Gammaproteobacteria bacterium]
MTTLRTYAVTASTTTAALRELEQKISAMTEEPRLLFAFYDCCHDGALLHTFLKSRFPRTGVIGGTSSGGFMTEHGFHGPGSIGLLCIDDPEGDYGVAAAPLGEDPAATAERLLHEALAACDCIGELPELIWLYQALGQEERVLEGLRRVVGDRCAIIGGSSADNDVTGQWCQLGPGGLLHDGLVVSVLFPSSPIGYAFQSGYEPTGESGIVTVNAGREILTIDNKPAAAVYNDWIGGHISSQLVSGGSVLAATTLLPIALDIGESDGVSNYLLIHPESVTPQGTLRTFSNLPQGGRIFAMKGDQQQLIERAGRVAEQARQRLPKSSSEVSGALLVYCGGCKLAIDERIRDVANTVRQGLGSAPFIGCFTFGEQGRILDQNMHGNLMISAIIFGS